MHGDDAYRGLVLVKALLPRIGMANAGPPDAAAMLADYAADEELRSLLGFNLFDGLTWFNKERFEEAARLGALFGSFASVANAKGPAALAETSLAASSSALEMIEAAAEAGYCYEGLEAALMKFSVARQAHAGVAGAGPAKGKKEKTVAKKAAAKPAPKGQKPVAKKAAAKPAPKKAAAKSAPKKTKPSPKRSGKPRSLKK